MELVQMRRSTQPILEDYLSSIVNKYNDIVNDTNSSFRDFEVYLANIIELLCTHFTAHENARKKLEDKTEELWYKINQYKDEQKSRELRVNILELEKRELTEQKEADEEMINNLRLKLNETTNSFANKISEMQSAHRNKMDQFSKEFDSVIIQKTLQYEELTNAKISMEAELKFTIQSLENKQRKLKERHAKEYRDKLTDLEKLQQQLKKAQGNKKIETIFKQESELFELKKRFEQEEQILRRKNQQSVADLTSKYEKLEAKYNEVCTECKATSRLCKEKNSVLQELQHKIDQMNFDFALKTQQLSAEITHLEEVTNTHHEEAIRIKREKQNLSSEIFNDRETLMDLNSSIQRMSQRDLLLDDEINEKSMQISSKEKMTKHTEQTILSLKKKLKAVIAEHDCYVREIEFLKQELNMSQQKIGSSNTELHKLRDKYEETQNLLKQKELELDTLQKDITWHNTKLKMMTTTNSENQNYLNEARHKIVDLENNFEKKRKIETDSISRLIKQKGDTKQELDRNIAENEYLLERLNEVTNNIKKAKEDINTLESDKRTRQLQTSLDNMLMDLDSMTNKQKLTENLLEATQKSLNSALEQYDTVRVDTQAINLKIEETTATIESLKSDIKVKQLAHLQTVRLLKDLSMKLQENDQAISHLKNDIKEKVSQLEDVRRQTSKVQQENLITKSGLEECRTLLSEKTNQMVQLTNGFSELNSYHKKKLGEALDEIRSLEISLHKNNAQYDNSSHELKEKNEELSKQKLKLNEILQQFDHTLFEKDSERLRELRSKLSVVQGEKESLKTDLEQRTSLYQHSIKVLEKSTNKMNRLNEQLEGLKFSLDNTTAARRQALKELKEQQKNTAIQEKSVLAIKDDLQKVISERDWALHKLEFTQNRLLKNQKLQLAVSDELDLKKGELKKVNQSIDSSIIELKHKESEILTSHQTITETTQILLERQKTVTSWEQELSVQTKNIEEMQQKLQQQDKTVLKLRDTLDVTCRSRDDFEIQCSQTSDLLEKLSEENSRTLTLIAEIDKELHHTNKELNGIHQEQDKKSKEFIEMQGTSERLQRYILQIKEEIKVLRGNLDVQERDTTADQLKDARIEKDNLKTQYIHFSAECDDLHLKIQPDQFALECKIQELTSLQNRVKQEQLSIKILEQDLEQIKYSLDQLKIQKKQLKNTLKEALSRKESISISFESLQTQIDLLTKDREVLQNKRFLLLLKLDALKKEIQADEKRMDALSLEIKALNQESHAQSKWLESFEAVKKNSESLRTENNKLSFTISELTSQHNQAEQDIAILQIENHTDDRQNNLQQTCDSLFEKIKILKQDKETSAEEIAQIKYDLDRLRIEKKENRNKIKMLSEKEKTLTQEREIQLQTIKKLEKEVAELDNSRSSFGKGSEQVEKMEVEILEMQKQTNTFEKEQIINEHSVILSQVASDKLNQLQIELDLLHNQNNATEIHIDALHADIEVLHLEKLARDARIKYLEEKLRVNIDHSISVGSNDSSKNDLSTERQKLTRSLEEEKQKKKIYEKEAEDLKLQHEQQLKQKQMQAISINGLKEQQVQVVKSLNDRKRRYQVLEEEIKSLKVQLKRRKASNSPPYSQDNSPVFRRDPERSPPSSPPSSGRSRRVVIVGSSPVVGNRTVR